MRKLWVAACSAAVLAFAALPAQAQNHVKIGIVNDQSGVFSESGGLGSVAAARIAAAEFEAAHPGTTVEIVSADHQNKPDVATAIVRRWFDTEGVDAVGDIQNAAISLAVQNLARQMGKISLVSGGTTPELYGKSCSPTGAHFAMDTYAFSVAPVRELAPDHKRWFFLTLDIAGGHLLEAEATKLLQAAGGTVVGHAKHPLGTTDMSAYMVEAQASGAQVLGLANAGTDAINAIKAANEFGLVAAGVRPAPLILFDTDIRAIGLPQAQGIVVGTSYYWDLNEQTRAFARKFDAQVHRMPTQTQANVYAAIRHYLKGVAAAGTVESLPVMAKMRELPVEMFSPNLGTLRPDGRVIYDTYVMTVKAPAQSKGEWDILNYVETIPMSEAFKPLSESVCPLLSH